MNNSQRPLKDKTIDELKSLLKKLVISQLENQ